VDNPFVAHKGLAVKLVTAALTEKVINAIGAESIEELGRPPSFPEERFVAVVSATHSNSKFSIYYLYAVEGIDNRHTVFGVSFMVLSSGDQTLLTHLPYEMHSLGGEGGSMFIKIAQFHVPANVSLDEITADGLAQYLTVDDE